MKTFPIPNFRATETKRDATDQDRTVLRRADGVVGVPLGALSGGPEWKVLWGLEDLGDQIETALTGANAAKTHFVTVAHGSHKWLVAWSLSLSEALGVFDVFANGSDLDLDATSAVTIAAPTGSPWRDCDGAAPWFLSMLGSKVFFGNGVDANLTWNVAGNTLALFSAPTPADMHDPGRETVPPCTCAAIGPSKHTYFAGNAAAPLVLYVARPPDSEFKDVEGLWAVDTSKVTLLLGDWTEIRGLSVWQNYVTVHTDKSPVNLFAADGDSTGQRARQAPSPSNASAPNPNCACDHRGHPPFYFGTDGEIYKDESTRTGPHFKHVQRDTEIVTAEAFGDWNRAMVKPVDERYSAQVFDPQTRINWVFSRTLVPSDRTALWAYLDQGDQVSGPFRYPNASTVGLFRGFTGKTIAVVITAAGEMLYANLTDVSPLEADEIDPPGTALGSAYEEAGGAPTPDPGVPYVGLNAAGTGFAQVVAGKRIELATPWAEWTETSALTLTRFFNNAHLGIVETGYVDLGMGDDVLKDFLGTFVYPSPRARFCIGVFVESENGIRSGRWFGSVFDREHALVPHYLRGTRVRIRLLVLWFNDQRAELRSLSAGYAVQGKR